MRVRDDGRAVGFPGEQQALQVEFVYTNCPTICVSLGQEFGQIQTALQRRGLSDRVRLVSLSFDIHRDTPAMLAAYAERHGADPRLWTVVRPHDEPGLARLLDIFGVTVVADGEGGYVHNAAVHYVGTDQRLSRIFGPGDAETVVAFIARTAP